MKKKGIIKALFILLWLVVIFMFSNQNAQTSLNLSNKVVYKIVECMHQKELSQTEKRELTKKYTFFIRKTAHFFLYFTLAFLIFILLKDICRINFKLWLIPIMCCCIYAITDEFHQTFINGRTAKVLDVCIDTCGAFLSSTLLYIASKHKNQKEKRLQK